MRDEILFDFPCSPTFRGYELEMMYGDIAASEMMPMERHNLSPNKQEIVRITQPSVNVLRELKRIDSDMQEHFKSHSIKKKYKRYD